MGGNGGGSNVDIARNSKTNAVAAANVNCSTDNKDVVLQWCMFTNFRINNNIWFDICATSHVKLFSVVLYFWKYPHWMNIGIYNIFRLPLPCYTSDYHHLYKTRLLLLMVDMLVADFVTMTHLRHVFNYLNCSLHPQIFFFDFPVNKV